MIRLESSPIYNPLEDSFTLKKKKDSQPSVMHEYGWDPTLGGKKATKNIYGTLGAF